MKTHVSLAAAFVAALVACGGNTPESKTPPATASATGTAGHGEVIATTGAQLPVAHWKTGDGLVGLVFDRSTDVIKVKVDGAKDVVQLTPEEKRSSGELVGTNYRSPDGKYVLLVSVNGGMEYYRGRDTFRLHVVERADALGAATVAGIAKDEKLVNQVECEKLAKNAVRVRFPSFTTNDASNPEKVRDAIEKADKAMLVHYVAKTEAGSFEELPYGVSGVGYGGVAYKNELKFDAKAGKGLQKYGGIVMGFSDYNSQGNHQIVQVMDGYPAPLADQTPGIVWEVDDQSTHAIFITLDGGRYRIDTSFSTVSDKGFPLVAGVAAPSAWPQPIQHAFAGSSEITGLAKIGGAPQKVADEIVAADDAWNMCAQGEWKKAKPEVEKLGMTDMNWSTRDARAKKLSEQWQERVRKTCKPHTDRLEKAALTFIEERVKVRMTSFEKAKAKFSK
jgi:hypothetical protein